ncbi:hypothetical protein HZH68_005545 [Vespula germanica]|uniref:Uncharacterized protein n=1 Tax=Vespula germanica TaxID=30212 RepID=A0A834KG78_VESGE|nr:hypothetical protein HZH68_005545 [Vespula germanica]
MDGDGGGGGGGTDGGSGGGEEKEKDRSSGWSRASTEWGLTVVACKVGVTRGAVGRGRDASARSQPAEEELEGAPRTEANLPDEFLPRPDEETRAQRTRRRTYVEWTRQSDAT